MNALAVPEVGQYLNDHFVAAFQKVASFKIVNGQKQGGNVAGYFCTPDGCVLDAVAGPVDGATLLREARWVVETKNLADLEGKDAAGLKTVFRQAHADRLAQEHGVRSKLAPRAEFTAADVAAVLDRGRGLDNDSRIHLLFATYPLAPIGKVYRPIFEHVLNEAVSTAPVQLGAAADTSGTPARVLAPTAADEREGRLEEQVLKARNDPPSVDVDSGRALNVLLDDLRGLDEKGAAIADMELDETVLARIHVVASGHGDVGPALLLQDPLPWPESLRTDDFASGRLRTEAALAIALAQAAKGPVARDAVQALVNAVDAMDAKVTVKVQAQAWSATDAIEAATFLSRLKESATVLRQPDVSGYLSDAYTAKGKTVSELVRSMASKGLHFAPALPGDEPGYRAVQRALARCDARTHAAAE